MTPRDKVRSETSSILQVLDHTAAALANRDFGAWASVWAHAPYVRRIAGWSRGGVMIADGWQDIASQMRRLFDERPDLLVLHEYGTPRENINVRVGGSMAWVTYDQYSLDSAGQSMRALTGFTRETWGFEKHSGEWKRTYLAYFHELPPAEESALLRVDENAEIVMLSRAAAATIGSSDVLRVRNGRLHAANRETDLRLQEAIRRTARVVPWAMGETQRVPFLLKDPSGSPDCICWITKWPDPAGHVMISVSDAVGSRRRLHNAVLIYRLSSAQARLAEVIVAGHSLVEAAEQLGVTISTARTQLNRMFEKIGVRSQPALVAALLSVANPLA